MSIGICRSCGFIGLAALAAFAVTHDAVQAQSSARTLPPTMWDSTDAYVRAYLGDSLFHTSVRPRPDLTRFQTDVAWSCRKVTQFEYCAWPSFTPFFVVFYELDPMSDPLRTGLMAVPIDTAGHIIRAFAPAGIPSCKYRPEQCRFVITGDSAIAIARAGLEKTPGVKWHAQFVWLDPPFLTGCTECMGRFSQWLEVKPAYGWEVRGLAENGHGYWTYVDATNGATLQRLESRGSN